MFTPLELDRLKRQLADKINSDRSNFIRVLYDYIHETHDDKRITYQFMMDILRIATEDPLLYCKMLELTERMDGEIIHV